MWESTWAKGMASGVELGCDFIKENKPAVTKWLATIKVSSSPPQHLIASQYMAACAEAGHDCAQERNNLEYSMASPFLVDAPKRDEAALESIGTEIFSKFTLTNLCPGACRHIADTLDGSPDAAGQDARRSCAWGTVRSARAEAASMHALCAAP